MPKALRRPALASKATSKKNEAEDTLLRRGIYEKAKRFEERVAELFGLLGYRTTVDYLRDDMQFDIRLEMPHPALPTYALIECKDLGQPVTQAQVREFASKVETIRDAEKKPYQAILVARSGFVNNAHTVAQTKLVHLLTFQQLLLSLVDLGPNLEAAIRSFEGTPLEHLYVEQDTILEKEIVTGENPAPKRLTRTVLEWLDHPTSTFLVLLGDFGCGKSSFCKRLAWELATKSKESPGESRIPILIDLREGGSTTVTLENLLTHHFQRLSNQAFNPQALLHLNREGYLLLIFDGFDETIAYTEPARYLDNLRQILRGAEGRAKVLLTCRTHYFRDRPEVLKRFGQSTEMISSPGATKLYEEIQGRPGAEIGYALEFREPQIEEYLKKALPPSENWKVFREQIRGTYNLEELAERPFLLEIIVKTLPRLLERGAAVTIADLYETYCESWFAHTDSRLTLTRDHKVTLVEHLACLIWNSPKNQVHYAVLADKAAEFFQNRPLSVIEKERIDYEVRTALFLHRDPEGYYSFIHRSFLEFFIARTLRKGLSKGDPTCFNLKRITREVAFFLEFWPEAKKVPAVAGRILKGRYQAKVSENALFLLYFYARASLGPLVGPGSEAEDLPTIRKVFSAERPKTLNLAGADLEGARIPGIDLSGAHLEGVRLTRADLRQASLDRAQLSKVVLAFADLRQGSAIEANFSGADLNHLDAQDAKLQGADLRNADLSFARFVRTNLERTRADGAQTIGTGFLGDKQLDLRLQLGHSGVAHSISWSPDGRFIAIGSSDGTVTLWDAESGRLLNSLQGHEDLIFSVAWAPDGRWIASGSQDQTVKLWDAESGRLLNSFQHHRASVFSVAWAPDGRRIASGSEDRTVKIWNAESGQLLNSLQGHDNSVLTVAWAPDGWRIASGSEDQKIKLWDAESGRPLSSLDTYEGPVFSVTWAPDGRRIASGSHDWTINLWNAESGRLLSSLQGHEDSVFSLAWAPDRWRIASGSLDRTVRLWDIESGQLLNFLPGHENKVLATAWAPDGWRIASGAEDQTVRLWGAESGLLLNSLDEHESSVLAVAWAPDGRRIASGTEDQIVRLWDAENGGIINSLHGHEDSVNSVVWGPDGRRIASGSSDRTVKLWDAESGKLLYSLNGHEDSVYSVAWRPDGQRIASGSSDRTIKLWDTERGRLFNSLMGHESKVLTVAWAPDGRQIASGAQDNDVKLWDAESGRLVTSFHGHESPVLIVAWAPDGQQIASGADNHTVQLWDVKTGKGLGLFRITGTVSSFFWVAGGPPLVLTCGRGSSEIWDLESNPPRPLVRLYHTPGSGFAATPDGYVSGPPEALEYVRFGDGWALYDLTDVPERLSPERVAAALNPVRRATSARRGKTTTKS